MPDFYVSNQIDISHVKQQISLPQDQILMVRQTLGEAQEALREAMRFGEVLKGRLAGGADARSVEDEALVNAELQAHDRLLQALHSIQEWLDLRGPSS